LFLVFGVLWGVVLVFVVCGGVVCGVGGFFFFFFFFFFVGGVVGVAFRSSNFENYQLLLQSTCNFLQPKQFGI